MNRLTARVAPAPPALRDRQRAEGPAASTSMAEGSGDRAGNCWPLQAMRRAAWGLLLGPCVALSWAGGTQSARVALQTWHAPFFITCFCCAWNLLLFPVYYLGQLLSAERRQGPTASFRQCSAFLGEEGVAPRVLLQAGAPFSVLWCLSGYMYLLALRRISTGDTSAILCCARAFAFLLSWIGLRDTFMGVRIVGAILSITGIVMMAYADGFHGDSIMGVALAVGSACTSALFKVLLRRHVGEEQPGGASVLMSCVGMCGVCVQSWLCVLLYLTGMEDWPPTWDAAWSELCLAGLLSLSFTVAVILGSALTYPALIALGILMGVPANAAADFYLTVSPQLSQVRLAAAGTIGAGYLLLLFPEHWDESALWWLGGLWRGGWRGESGEEVDAETMSHAKAKPAGVVTSL